MERPAEGLEGAHGFDGVDDHAQGDPPRQLAHLLQPGEDQRERPGEVVEAVVGEDAGLVQRRNGEAGDAQGALALGDLDALVGLDVRAQRHAEAGGALGHAAQVALQDVEVEEEGRGGNSIQRRHRSLRGRPYIIE